MSFAQNPFALLAGQEDGDVSDNELPKQSKPVQVDAAPAKSGTAATGRNAPKAAGTGSNQPKRTVPGQTSTRPQKEVSELPASDAPAGSAGQFEGERGRDSRGTGFGRGRGGARGGRGDNKEHRRGAGERRGGQGGQGQRLDRRSATGRTDSEKVEHQAWGGDDGKRELEAENAGVSDAVADKTAADTETVAPAADGAAAPAASDADKAAAPEVPAEPEDNSLTYEEYLKQQKAAGRGALDSLQVKARQVNEGQDESQWKDGKLVEKVEEIDLYSLGSAKDKAAKQKEQKERKQKTVLETEFHTAGPRVSDRGERGGRGGRGRGEGRGAPRGAGRGRGAAGPRGGRGGARTNGQQGVNLDDASAFPSLS